MRKWSCTLEAVTPLVIGGAQGKASNVVREGLRTQEVKGSLRFWLRAMMGGIVGDDIEILKKIEGDIFGDTDQRSKFRIETCFQEPFRPINAYLRMNDPPVRPAIPPGTTHDLSLHGYAPQRYLDFFLTSLWALVMLGGVGARVRRGFGSLAFCQENSSREDFLRLGLPLTYSHTNLSLIAGELSSHLHTIQHACIAYANKPHRQFATKYRALSAKTAKLYLVRPQGQFWKTGSDAMDSLRDDIYRPFKKSIRAGGVKQIGGIPKPGVKQERSPLLIQIKKTNANGYFGVILAFDDQYDTCRYFGKGWTKFDSFLRGLSRFDAEHVHLP